MPRRDLLLSVLRLGFAAAGVAAIAYQASSLEAAHVFRAGNFFSFFTIHLLRPSTPTPKPSRTRRL